MKKNIFDNFSHVEKEILLSDIQSELNRLIYKNQADPESVFNTHYSNYIKNHIKLIDSIKSCNDLDYLLDESLYMRLRKIAEKFL